MNQTFERILCFVLFPIYLLNEELYSGKDTDAFLFTVLFVMIGLAVIVFEVFK